MREKKTCIDTTRLSTHKQVFECLFCVCVCVSVCVCVCVCLYECMSVCCAERIVHAWVVGTIQDPIDMQVFVTCSE